MKKILILIFAVVFLAGLVHFYPSKLEIVEVHPGQLFISPDSTGYFYVIVKNNGFGIIRDPRIIIEGIDLNVTEQSFLILPFQKSSILVKVFSSPSLKQGVYNVRLIASGGEFEYKVIVETSEKIHEHRLSRLWESLKFLKILNENDTRLGAIESYLINANKSLEQNSIAKAEMYMDLAENVIDKIKYEEREKEFPLKLVVGIIVLISIIGLIFIFKPKVALPKIKRKSSVKLPKIKIEKSVKVKTKEKEETGEKKTTSPLAGEMLKLIEEQYRAGLISDSTYRELKKKYSSS